ncbi:MAG TPA: hypothetical protein VHD33_00195 [Legionellaceae bacterium]|nr:hypothetical protein [Legionellaceae bacterium]
MRSTIIKQCSKAISFYSRAQYPTFSLFGKSAYMVSQKALMSTTQVSTTALAINSAGYQQYTKFLERYHVPMEAEHSELMEKYRDFVRDYMEGMDTVMHEVVLKAFLDNELKNRIDEVLRLGYESTKKNESLNAIYKNHTLEASNEKNAELSHLRRYIERTIVRGYTPEEPEHIYGLYCMLVFDARRYDGSCHGPTMGFVRKKYSSSEDIVKASDRKSIWANVKNTLESIKKELAEQDIVTFSKNLNKFYNQSRYY